MNETTRQNARDRVVTWFEETVLALTLCPFAAAPYREDLIRFFVAEASNFDEALEALFAEIEHLIAVGPRVCSTTLVIFPDALEDFEEFLDAAGTAEALLDEANLLSAFQIATFHPDYHFANESDEDVSNYTNRSPLPILHILRQEEISDALLDFPDPENIPTRNIARIGALSRDELERRWPHAHPPAPRDLSEDS